MLTPEQINEIRTKSGLKPLEQTSQPTKNFVGRFDYLKNPSYLERVGKGYKSGAENITSEIKKSAENVGKMNFSEPGLEQLKIAGRLGETGLRTTGEVIKTAFMPIGEAISPVIKPLIEKIALIPGVSSGIKAVIDWANKHPEIAKDLDATLNIALLGVTKSVEPVIKKSVKSSARGVVDVSKNIISPAIAATKGAKEYLSSRTPKLLGIFSGESDDVISQALKNPKMADVGIEGGDVALRNAVIKAGENSIKIKNAFIKSYSEAKNKALGIYTKTLIPKSNVLGEFYSILRKYGVKIKNGVLDFTTSNIKANPGEMSKITAALESLRGWEKFTVSSLDDFKHHIGKLTKFAQEAGGSSKSPVLGTFYHRIDEIIKSKLPTNLKLEYTNLNKKFSESISLMDDMVDAFNSGDPFTKLAGALGKNKDSIRQVVDFYEKKAKDNILAVVAGRELAMEKTAAFGFLNPRSWIDYFISPKVQGKIITNVGSKIQNKVK